MREASRLHVLRVARRGEGERGATAVMLGLMMAGLVGFTGLAVDGAATMAKQQELQNGADAAALAAAAECGSTGCDAIDSAAGPYGAANVSDTAAPVDTTFEVNASAQTVKATVAQTKSHWFLPVIGVASSDLDAEATASWGQPIEGPATLPLSISMCSFERALGVVDLDVQKDIFLNKNGSESEPCSWGGTYPAGGFGWLTDTDGDCEVPVAVEDWVVNDPGMDAPACDWDSYVNKVVLIPVFSDRKEPPEDKATWTEKFAAFKLLGITPSNGSSPYGQACGPRPDASKYHKACLTGIFEEYVTSADDYIVDDGESEVTIVRLID